MFLNISYLKLLFYYVVVFDFFDASKAGLAISQAMILTGMVQLGSQQATEVVNQMMSVERILEYTNLEQESSEGSTKGNLNYNNLLTITTFVTTFLDDLPVWPSKGHIKFKNMFLRYQLNDPPVLKNLNFSILPGQKVSNWYNYHDYFVYLNSVVNLKAIYVNMFNEKLLVITYYYYPRTNKDKW